MPSRKPTTPPRRKHPNTKRTGELAEAAFVVKAAGLGFAVSKPWGDSERYDFILDAGHATFRVQIKCTESLNANGYQVQSTYTDRNQKGHYSTADIDFLVGYILPLDLWYVVPSHALPPSASLRFYPEGNITRRPRFEQYREAWHLFQQPPKKDDSEKHCHPEQSEGSASDKTCHPHAERSEEEGPASQTTCHPYAERSEEEGPAVSSTEQTPNTAPIPESPMERMMSQWAKRVDTLYNRKR